MEKIIQIWWFIYVLPIWVQKIVISLKIFGSLYGIYIALRYEALHCPKKVKLYINRFEILFVVINYQAFNNVFPQSF